MLEVKNPALEGHYVKIEDKHFGRPTIELREYPDAPAGTVTKVGDTFIAYSYSGSKRAEQGIATLAEAMTILEEMVVAANAEVEARVAANPLSPNDPRYRGI